MSRRQTPPLEIPDGFKLGAEFDHESWRRHELVVDLSGDVHCYVGFISDDQPPDLAYYGVGVGLREGRDSHQFVKLQRGMLMKRAFLRPDTHYRVVDNHFLVLPSGSNPYFGVVSRPNNEENAELTRQVFGGTLSEIESVARALAKVTGLTFHEMARLPRITFSSKRDNDCDISGALIPSNFPYVAFDESKCRWGHVSLHSFYRLLAFMCPEHRESPVRNTLLKYEVSPDVLVRLLNCAELYNEPLRGPARM